jgi:hypothetical protein
MVEAVGCPDSYRAKFTTIICFERLIAGTIIVCELSILSILTLAHYLRSTSHISYSILSLIGSLFVLSIQIVHAVHRR